MNSLLSASTIGGLGDGKGAEIIDQALQIAIRDADIRGSDEKPRKVIITIDFLKTNDSSLSIGLEVEVKAPKLHIQRTAGELKWRGNKQILEIDLEDAATEEAA